MQQQLPEIYSVINALSRKSEPIKTHRDSCCHKLQHALAMIAPDLRNLSNSQILLQLVTLRYKTSTQTKPDCENIKRAPIEKN